MASRYYLNEKWQSAKRDMEGFLEVDNDKLPNRIDQNEIDRCKYGVISNLKAIINELSD